jgi:hypothetical protein
MGARELMGACERVGVRERMFACERVDASERMGGAAGWLLLLGPSSSLKLVVTGVVRSE